MQYGERDIYTHKMNKYIIEYINTPTKICTYLCTHIY